MKNPSKLEEFSADLTYAFPDVFSLALGFDQSDPVSDAVVCDPIILGSLNSFSRTVVRLAAFRLNVNAESQSTTTHQTNADAMNRFAEMERFEKSVGKTLTIHLMHSCAFRS